MTSPRQEQKENWSSEVTLSLSLDGILFTPLVRLAANRISVKVYQNVASFVPKLATVVLGWLDVQRDDVILDVGCGGTLISKHLINCKSTANLIPIDGVLNLQIAQILATGTGKIHGIDSSVAMIESAKKAASSDNAASKVCTFEGSFRFLSKILWIFSPLV